MPVFVCNAVLADELWDPLAQKTLYKRSDSSWDNFDDYKESAKTICFVEHVVDYKTVKRFLECSHALAAKSLFCTR